MKKSLSVILVLFALDSNSYSQIKFGADLYSRYIWRGVDFGDAPAIQPSLAVTIGSFSIGAWGSYAFPTSGTTYSENDLWCAYSIAAEKSGTFSLILTDYYIPSAGIPFGVYKPKTGGSAAHTIESGLSYTGPDSFPVSLVVYTNLSNDPRNSSYIQAGYPLSISDVTFILTAGFVPSQSDYYLTRRAGFVNLSVTASKSFPVSENFSVPVNVSYTINPSIDKAYLVFGASFIF